MTDKVEPARLFALIRKFSKLFAKYPEDLGVHPGSLEQFGEVSSVPIGAPTLAIQSVADKFYFLIFGAIAVKLSQIRTIQTDLIMVRSVNGGIGTRLPAEIKRSTPVAWLWNRSWRNAFAPLKAKTGYSSVNWWHLLQDLKDWLTTKNHWQVLKKNSQNPSLKIDQVEVADLIIDSYLRLRPSPKFDVNDPFVRKLIWQAMRDVRQARNYFRKAKPIAYLTSYTTYIEHGVAARVALDENIKVWSFGNLNSFCKALSREDSYHTPNFAKYNSIFESLPNQEEKLSKAREQLETRLSGGVDLATSYMRKSAYSTEKHILPKGLERSVVIFMHDFYDSPHIYPDLIFPDFWQWMAFTIEVLTEAKIPFFIKPHPNQIALSDLALDQLKAKYPTTQWLDTRISNVQLAQAGIACGVTVYGTVAHELAFLGVPSIGCARHPHHSFSFCRTAATQSEYASMLRTFEELPVEKAEMQRQALAFYYMHNIYGEPQLRDIQRSFVKFWKTCNVGTPTLNDINKELHQLIKQPAFDQFIQQLAELPQ